MVWLETLSQTRCLDGSEPVVHVMEKMQVVSKLQAQSLEQFRDVHQIFFR